MSTGSFEAGVKYNDWRGSVAADDANQHDIRRYLESKGIYDSNTEFLLSVSVYFGENFGHENMMASLTALVSRHDNYEDVENWLKTTPRELKVRKIDIDIPFGDFVALFKRMNIVLNWQKLLLEGREYQSTP